MKKLLKNDKLVFWGGFAGKTIFYLVILLALVYLYHFSHVGGSKFIYNEF